MSKHKYHRCILIRVTSIDIKKRRSSASGDLARRSQAPQERDSSEKFPSKNTEAGSMEQRMEICGDIPQLCKGVRAQLYADIQYELIRF
jgi:hypothetical protein